MVVSWRNLAPCDDSDGFLIVFFVDLLVLFDFELAFGSFFDGFLSCFFLRWVHLCSLKVKVSLLWTQGWRRM